jgi:hypothetical protein
MRPKKWRWHFETMHPVLKNKPLEFFESKLEELKKSKGKFSHFTKINEKAMHASYLISLRIAQAGKPHTIGESLVLPAIKKTRLELCLVITRKKSKGFCFPMTRLHAESMKCRSGQKMS